MGRVYLQSIRLAIALVCLGASLILASHWFGLLPDVAKYEADARRQLSEAMAINAAAHVRKSQWPDLKVTCQTLVDRNEELLSIGIRSKRGQLKIDAGHHHDMWEKLQSGAGGIEAVNVPITLNRRDWGQVEFCYQAGATAAGGSIFDHPLIRLLGFFCIVGTFGYTVFVGKVMRIFSTTQVVPERVRQALDTLAEGLLVLDEKARIVLANRAFAQTVDVPADLLVDSGANDLPWTDENDVACEDHPWMTAIDESATVTEKMLHLQVGTGKKRIFSVNAAPIGGGGARRGALATFRDVTHIEEHRAELEMMLSMLRNSRDEIEQKNRELEILATQDSLTGCLNRRAFFERFGRLWKIQLRDAKPLSCLMIDNDHFKKVNDTYGHNTGDDVLRKVASTLKRLFQDIGLVCRYGGEEFCILLPGIDFEQASEHGETARAAIEAIRLDDPAELRLSASVGVSETRFKAADPQELINQADICLYAAKRSGRNCVIPYNENLSQMQSEIEEHGDRKGVNIPYQAVTALVSTLSYRDAYTAEHSRRVAELCTRVASHYMDIQDSFLLEIAALLHDIGKVGVPDEILLKPGPLSEAEWEIMSRHDRIGVEIVANAFECEELNDILQARHSRFDGAGRYVNLPNGEDIPLGGRILSICDSYDSMVTDRVYRKGRSHEEAVDELRRCAGTQFDPELVEHFASVVSCKPETADGRSAHDSAIQIGFQVERLAAAIDVQDAEGIRTLAARLGMYARHCELNSIAIAADRICDHASLEEILWFDLLRDTNELLDICRATQSEMLRRSLDVTPPLAPPQLVD